MVNKMKLFLLTQNINNEYDTFDSCVVAAEDAETARNIHPSTSRGEYNPWPKIPEGVELKFNPPVYSWSRPTLLGKRVYTTWAYKPEEVMVKYIGEAATDIESGVICASYNAG